MTETPGQQGRFDLAHGHVHDVVTAAELDRVGPVAQQLVRQLGGAPFVVDHFLNVEQLGQVVDVIPHNIEVSFFAVSGQQCAVMHPAFIGFLVVRCALHRALRQVRAAEHGPAILVFATAFGRLHLVAEHQGHGGNVRFAGQVDAHPAGLAVEVLNVERGIFAGGPVRHVQPGMRRRHPNVQVLGLEGVLP
ncbi:hypothetical protein D3C75_920700 [compost metagenome]